MRSRIFNIMQYEKHPVTGETLLTEDTIKIALSHKSLRDWAYIAHTEDVYSADDEEQQVKYIQEFYKCHDANKENGYLAHIVGAREDRDKMSIEDYTKKYQWKCTGQKKPKHWHIVVRSANAIEVDVIARWFGIPKQYVEVPKGHGAFLDCVEYLVHEGKKAVEQGKVHYDDSLVVANFDFRKALTEMTEKRVKYGKDVSERDEIRHKVLFEGLSISQLCKTPEGHFAYLNDYATLDKLRVKYIQTYAEMPTIRINYYVCGKGGDGKDLMCRALARSLVKSLGMEIESDEDIYFEVGANNATFEGYDGQPVIIWNDFRAGELLKVLGGRGNVFKVFEAHPKGRGKQNIKYGSITLINQINIVNSVQDFHEFLDGLAGDYKKQDGTTVELAEDKGQSYRRFPFIIPIRESDFDILMNKGVFEGTREYEQYIAFRRLRGSMKKIATALSGNPEMRREIEERTVQPIVNKHQLLVEKMNGEQPDEATMAEFEKYGTQRDEHWGFDIDDGHPIIVPSPVIVADDGSKVLSKSEEIQMIEYYDKYEKILDNSESYDKWFEEHIQEMINDMENPDPNYDMQMERDGIVQEDFYSALSEEDKKCYDEATENLWAEYEEYIKERDSYESTYWTF